MALFLVEGLMRLAGFVLFMAQESRNKIKINGRNEYRIMCIGESTTAIGGQNSYPGLLEKILNERSHGVKFKVVNKGIVGVSSSNIITDLKKNVEKYKPDMVVSMMGINDCPVTKFYFSDTSRGRSFFSHSSLKICNLIEFIRSGILTKFKEKDIVKPEKDEKAFLNTNIRDGSEKKRDMDLCETGGPGFKDAVLEREKIDDSPATEGSGFKPGSYEEFVKLGRFYCCQGRYIQSEEVFKKALKLYPEQKEIFLAYGHLCCEKGEYFKAEKLFRKAVDIDSQYHSAYIKLAEALRYRNEYACAEAVLKKVFDLNAGSDEAYLEMGMIYREWKKYPQADKMYKRAIEMNPANNRAYMELGFSYREQKKEIDADVMFEKALSLSPKDDLASFTLGTSYLLQKKYARAEKLLRKTIEANPFNDKAYGALAVVYLETGDYISAKEHFKKAAQLQKSFCYALTVRNYKLLKEILDDRGIRLVCVQYPMLDPMPLEMIFDGENGIIFVDNEGVFKDAVKKGGYRKYFIDAFAGSFGHCTFEGNKLLADNIAGRILSLFEHSRTSVLK